MVAKANTYDISFKFGIPASASIKEFESINNNSSGYQQLQYVEAAINAINIYAKSQENFLGTDLWAFSSMRLHKDVEFNPTTPPQGVLNYLGSNL